jgi:hypothetical protein
MSDGAQKSLNRRDLFVSVTMVLIFIVAHPYGFLEAEDASVYFGYYNNSSHPGFPFYYAGYAALLPQMVAFLASPLPLWLQPLAYMLVAIVLGTYFILQLNAILKHYVKVDVIVYCLAATIVLFLLKSNSSFNLFTNMTYSIWSGMMGFILRLVLMLHGRRAGRTEMIVTILALASHPSIVLGVPIIALVLLVRPLQERTLRLEAIVYLTAILLFFMLLIDHSVVESVTARELLKQSVVVLITHVNAYVVLGAVALMGLAAAAIGSIGALRQAWRTRSLAGAAALDLWVLTYFGMASLAVYGLSPRFLFFSSLSPRYIVGVVVSAFLAGVIVLARWPIVERYVAALSAGPAATKPRIAAFAGASAWVILLVGANSMKGAQTPKVGMAATIAGERFLIAVADWRKSCQGGAMAHHWDRWAPVVLCHPTDLPAGVEPVGITSKAITVFGQPDVALLPNPSSDDRPRIFQPMRDIAFIHG